MLKPDLLLYTDRYHPTFSNTQSCVIHQMKSGNYTTATRSYIVPAAIDDLNDTPPMARRGSSIGKSLNHHNHLA